MAAPAEEEAGGGVSELCSPDWPGGEAEEAVTGGGALRRTRPRKRVCGWPPPGRAMESPGPP